MSGFKATLRTATLAFVISHASLVAQWSYTNLQPAGITTSEAVATTLTQQAGYGLVPIGGGSSVSHAAIWSGSAASAVDLNPLGATLSSCFGTTGSQQVGQAWFAGPLVTAGLWSGTAASFVSLGPAGASSSIAYGTDGTQQVGQATIGGINRAALWSGTAATFVDLHPAGASMSLARSLAGGVQGGWATFPPAIHAGIWSGAATTFIDLHPAGATGFSAVYAVVFGQQAGSVGGHAAIWSGSAASFVDLHPAGALFSELRATTGVWQAGTWTSPSGATRAGLWKGSSATFFDLHAVLGGSFTYSQAFGIAETGGNIVVAGMASGIAVTWTLPSFALGVTTSGGGIGDVAVSLVGVRPTATDVLLLISATAAPAGAGMGPFFGLFFPDALLFYCLATPSAPYSLLHFPVTANPYAGGPVVGGPGTMSAFAGQTWDVTAICYGPVDGISGQTTVQRLSW